MPSPQVWARTSLLGAIPAEEVAVSCCGLGGMHAKALSKVNLGTAAACLQSRGGSMLTLRVHGTSLCFYNVHLCPEPLTMSAGGQSPTVHTSVAGVAESIGMAARGGFGGMAGLLQGGSANTNTNTASAEVPLRPPTPLLALATPLACSAFLGRSC